MYDISLELVHRLEIVEAGFCMRKARFRRECHKTFLGADVLLLLLLGQDMPVNQ